MHLRFLSLLAVAMGATTVAQAQSDVSLGLKAGGSLTSFVGKQAGNSHSIAGFHAGGFANIGITSMLAFQPEILFSQKGARVVTPPLPEQTRRLTYLDIPLLLHVNADGLFFEAGPQVGVILAARHQTGSLSVDRKEAYNTVDVGFVAGVGYQRKTGPGIGLRYNAGLTNIYKPETIGPVQDQLDVRNSALQLYVTYSFGGQ